MKTKEQITTKLKKYFKKQREVIVVYLFGSYATGKQNDKSDLDIAVQFEYGIECEKRIDLCLKYYVDLVYEFEIDIVDLNSADLPLLKEIFEEGVVLVENDRDKRVKFKAVKLSQSLDLQYYEYLMSQGLMRRARNLI